jgi:hypothetical protein
MAAEMAEPVAQVMTSQDDAFSPDANFPAGHDVH